MGRALDRAVRIHGPDLGVSSVKAPSEISGRSPGMSPISHGQPQPPVCGAGLGACGPEWTGPRSPGRPGGFVTLLAGMSGGLLGLPPPDGLA